MSEVRQEGHFQRSLTQEGRSMLDAGWGPGLNGKETVNRDWDANICVSASLPWMYWVTSCSSCRICPVCGLCSLKP